MNDHDEDDDWPAHFVKDAWRSTAPPPAYGSLEPLEPTTLQGGMIIRAHREDACAGYWCCIHYPSPHHMSMWYQMWQGGRMYRVCPHNVMHPDPDDFINRDVIQTLKKHKKECDGCCKRPFDGKELL